MITQLSSGRQTPSREAYQAAVGAGRWAGQAGADWDAPARPGVKKDVRRLDKIPQILIVDDDESFGRMLERVIAKLTGYACLYAEDADKALDILESSIVDVVIADIRMPGMNGLDLTAAIKTKYASDVIIVTGNTEEFTFTEAIKHGANDFIEKPVQPEELIIKLERTLRERNNAAQYRQAEKKLLKMNLKLEKRVEERHAELLRLNALLQGEINEHRQAEEEAHLSEKRYRLAMDAAHEGIWEIDLINKKVKCNKTFSDQFGNLPETGLPWQWWIERIHPEDAERTITGFTSALEGAITSWSQEYRFLRPDGTYAHVLNRAYIERDRTGTATNVYGAMLDITSLRQIEIELVKKTLQLEEANRELDSFGYTVAHDLREPLRALDGFSRMLIRDLKDKLDGSTQHTIDVIRAKVKRMDQLIEDVLTFSRLNRQAMTVTAFDMEQLTTEVWNELQESFQQPHAIIKISNVSRCHGDCNMIRQVLVNLLANALKFTQNREAAKIEVGGYETTAESVYFVKDNGAGFDMQYSDKLFKIFQRLHSEEEYKGTGVGLSFVKRIIERHGGRVWAESKLNEGATFYFTLPRQIQ